MKFKVVLSLLTLDLGKDLIIDNGPLNNNNNNNNTILYNKPMIKIYIYIDYNIMFNV